MKQIFLYILLVFLPLGIWGQTTSIDFECEGCDTQDWAKELTNQGYLDLSDVEEITISDNAYSNIEGDDKKISLVLKTREDGSETTTYELTDVLDESIGGFNGGEGNAIATIHYITEENCESAMGELRSVSSSRSRSADYTEDIYIIDLAGDGSAVQIFTSFSFSSSFQSGFLGGGSANSRSAGFLGPYTKKLLFNGFKKVVTFVSSKNPWSIAINVVASYGIGGLVEHWVGDHSGYPEAFYANMLNEGFTGFLATLIDAYGEGLTSSIITATISSILKGTVNGFDPQMMLFDIAVGTVLNLLTTSKNIERMRSLVGNVRTFKDDLTVANNPNARELLEAVVFNPRLVKAWEKLFSNQAWRTNTGYLAKVSRYTDEGIDIVEQGGKIKAKTASGLEIGDLDALEEVAENALKVKGKFSGRHFDPDKAGGVIVRKSWQNVSINQAGIDDVITHTSRFDDILGENAMMIERLQKIKNGEIPITDFDKRYYTHELEEYARYKNLGIADGVDPGNEVWNNAHSATLEVYSITDEASLIFH